MALIVPSQSKFFKLSFYRQQLPKAASLMVFLAIVYEFPASIVVGVWAAFGIYQLDGFTSYRLVFAAFVIAVCALNAMLSVRGIFMVREFQVYLFIFTYMVAVVWLNRDEFAFLGSAAIHSSSAVEFWLPIFYKYLLFFFIGLRLTYLRTYKYLLLLCLILASIVILQNVDYEILGLDKKNYVAVEGRVNHLFLGDAFSLTALLALAFVKGDKSRVGLFLFCAAVIFLIGSRTSFILFVFVVLLYFMLLFRIKWILYYLAIFFAFVGFVSTLDVAELADRNERMIGVFTDYDDDGSVQARRVYAERGWEDIKNNPILGRFGGQRDSDVIGTRDGWRAYMHSMFSYWRQFGLLVFVLICYIYFRFAVGVLARLRHKNTEEFRVLFLVGTFIIIESLLSRSFSFSATHLIFGMAVTMYLRKPKEDMASNELHNLLPPDVVESTNSATKERRRRRRRSNRKLSF